MNLRSYFKEIRDLQESLGSQDVIIKSLKTPDGGREGVFTEVAPRLAAQLIKDVKAVLATEEEAEAFRGVQTAELRRAEEERAAQRIQVHLLPTKPTGRKR